MSLETPIKIRDLQRKLYRKAKEEPDYRFYLLYDKNFRKDNLRHAYDLAKANHQVCLRALSGARLVPTAFSCVSSRDPVRNAD